MPCRPGWFSWHSYCRCTIQHAVFCHHVYKCLPCILLPLLCWGEASPSKLISCRWFWVCLKPRVNTMSMAAVALWPSGRSSNKLLLFFLFSMRKFMYRIFVTYHFYGLDDCRYSEYAPDHPINILLAAGDALHQPFTSKNENTIPG